MMMCRFEGSQSFENDQGVVDAVTLWCVDDSEVNAEQSEDDVHLGG